MLVLLLCKDLRRKRRILSLRLILQTVMTIHNVRYYQGRRESRASKWSLKFYCHQYMELKCANCALNLNKSARRHRIAFKVAKSGFESCKRTAGR